MSLTFNTESETFREIKIKEIEKRIAGCVRVLKVDYKPEILKLWCDLTKELEIQKAYLAHE